MSSHRDFMRSLTPADKRSLTKKSDTLALVKLAVYILLSAIFSVAIATRITLWPVLLLPQGLLLISLFHLLHECIHDTPFHTQKINTLVGAICGFIILIPSEWFRYFHRDHHRYTQIEGKDPELATQKPSTRSQYLLHISGMPVFKSLVSVIFKCALGKTDENYIPDAARATVIKQAQAMGVLYCVLIICSIALQNTTLLWIWTVPLIIGQPFLRLYLLAEHTLCENTENMFLNTRTVLTNPVVRFFTWNMPYHTEHHAYPAVPFHQLPTLHEKMNDYLANTNNSYREFNQQFYKTLT